MCRKCEEASKTYKKVERTAWKAYEKARNQALKAYKKVERPAFKAYEKVQEEAWKAYEKVTEHCEDKSHTIPCECGCHEQDAKEYLKGCDNCEAVH